MAGVKDKVVLVAGGTSGIGRAATRLLVERGAAVVFGGRRVEAGERLVAELRERGGRIAFRATDVTKNQDNEALVALAVSMFGRLDVAVNNVGLEARGSLAAFDDATYDKVFDTNVRAAFWSIRVQLPELAKTRGSIVLMSSTAGSRGLAQAAVYTASKHAVEGIMRAATHELAPQGIRINVVAPGPTATEMLDRFTGGRPEVAVARVPLGRAASAEEVAEAVVWLASDEARFVNGAVVPVNGGLTA